MSLYRPFPAAVAASGTEKRFQIFYGNIASNTLSRESLLHRPDGYIEIND